MIKATLITLLGFVSMTQAIELDLTYANFFRNMHTFDLVRAVASAPLRLESTASPVTWSECSSQHLYDDEKPSNSPTLPIVGKSIALNLDILFNQDLDIAGNLVNVDFTQVGSSNPVTLFRQDYTDKKHVSDGQEYKQSISWLIPTFAPLGHYKVVITTHGASKTEDIYACACAEFEIK